MRISVLVPSYCRSWALRLCLESLARQRRSADEVVVVLKSCGDDSESVVEEYSRVLPIRLVRQSSGGGCADAYELGYRNSSGDIVLFIDDDAVADESWVSRYEELFREHPDAGAIGGLVYRAYVDERGNVVKTGDPFYPEETTAPGPHREPLRGLEGYCTWISSSGLMGSGRCGDTDLSVKLGGANMGFRASLIEGFPLARLYGRSRKCFRFEELLAYRVVAEGYRAYAVRDPGRAPVVYHIAHGRSLTRGRGFWHEFWMHYDRVAMFWRLRELGAPVSMWRYMLGLAVLLRRRTVPRLLATVYGLLARA